MSATAARHVIARQREHDALELRKSGAGYGVIAERLQCSRGAAFNAVKRALERLESDIDADAKSLRKLELERTDRAMLAIWHQIIAGNLGAIDRFVKLSELRAKYLRLDDAPEETSALAEWLASVRGS